MATTIEWTNKTWNPTTGCTKISAGCKFCYAEVMHKRLRGMGQAHYSEPFTTLRTHADFLDLPRTWKKPTKVFVNSMSDLFHEDIPLEFIQAVFKVMNETPQHTYQILTKRSKRLREVSDLLNWTPNIWMGVSVEDYRVESRIYDLINTPAKVKWLSIEPMIGPISELLEPGGRNFPYLDRGQISWVVCGGESGHKARAIKIEWVHDIKDECYLKKIPFFFKQWGSPRNNPNPSDPTMKKGHPNYAKGGCQIDGKVYRAYPETTQQ